MTIRFLLIEKFHQSIFNPIDTFISKRVSTTTHPRQDGTIRTLAGRHEQVPLPSIKRRPIPVLVPIEPDLGIRHAIHFFEGELGHRRLGIKRLLHCPRQLVVMQIEGDEGVCGDSLGGRPLGHPQQAPSKKAKSNELPP